MTEKPTRIHIVHLSISQNQQFQNKKFKNHDRSRIHYLQRSLSFEAHIISVDIHTGRKEREILGFIDNQRPEMYMLSREKHIHCVPEQRKHSAFAACGEERKCCASDGYHEYSRIHMATPDDSDGAGGEAVRRPVIYGKINK